MSDRAAGRPGAAAGGRRRVGRLLRLVGEPGHRPVPRPRRRGPVRPAGGQRHGEGRRVVPRRPARPGGPEPAGPRLPAADVDAGAAGAGHVRPDRDQPPPGDDEPGAGRDQGAAGPPAADGRLPVVQAPQGQAVGRDPGGAGRPARGARGRLPGRGRRAPEPQARPGLDEPRDAEARW